MADVDCEGHGLVPSDVFVFLHLGVVAITICVCEDCPGVKVLVFIAVEVEVLASGVYAVPCVAGLVREVV